MLPGHYSINDPLFIRRVQPHLQDTETLNRPEHEPGLAGILADVFRRKALN